MPNEIDALMALDPLELSAQDIDAIIIYQRKARAAYTSGAKPRKGSDSSPSISLEAIGLGAKSTPIKRRKV